MAPRRFTRGVLLERPEFRELSVNTVAKRMRHKGLRAKTKPVRRSLTRADPAAPKFAILLQRRFDPPAANVSWCGAIERGHQDPECGHHIA